MSTLSLDTDEAVTRGMRAERIAANAFILCKN